MEAKHPHDAAEVRPLVDTDYLARRTGLSKRTVESPQFLKRFGLSRIKIGRSVRFDADDVEKAIERARCPGCGDE